LHGPHHSAQKSTRTGVEDPSTSVSKLASVTVEALLIRWCARTGSPLHLTSSEACRAKGPIVSDGIFTLSDATFDESIGGADTAVIVDFWAEWCGPCKMVAPVLEEIASEHGDKITIAKVNIDENPEIARRYQIMSIPTMSVFSGGEVVRSIVGAKPKAALLRDLEGIL
jgi:thioredoxin 1